MNITVREKNILRSLNVQFPTLALEHCLIYYTKGLWKQLHSLLTDAIP